MKEIVKEVKWLSLISTLCLLNSQVAIANDVHHSKKHNFSYNSAQRIESGQYRIDAEKRTHWAIASEEELNLKASLSDEQTAREYILRNRKALVLTKADIINAELKNIHHTKKGAILAQFIQKESNLEIYGQILTVVMNKKRELISFSGTLQAGLQKDRSHEFKISTANAAVLALNDLLDVKLNNQLTIKNENHLGYHYFDYPSFALPVGYSLERPVRLKKILFPTNGHLIPAYYVETWLNISGDKKNIAFSAVISGKTGKTMLRKDLSASDAFNFRVWADEETGRPMDNPLGNGFTPSASLNTPLKNEVTVRDQNIISTNGRNIHQDPWLNSGATETKGNNAFAYTDSTGRNGFDANDASESINEDGTFGAIYNADIFPKARRDEADAAVTNMFYTVNYLHDMFYDYGFDEVSGNGQNNNYGRGGAENDGLLLEAQDKDRQDNAEMITPADGESPKMQAGLFYTSIDYSLYLPTQDLEMEVLNSMFGYPWSENDIRAPLKQALNHDALPSDGCTEISNNLSGSIAYIKSGPCSLAQKVKNAEQAGALRAVVVTDTTTEELNRNLTVSSEGEHLFMSEITIQAVLVHWRHQDEIELSLGQEVVIRANSMKDGTLDNQMIAHEWGHYMFGRLVGGGVGAPNGQGRSINEGTADFISLLLSVREEDQMVAGNEEWQGAYPMFAYISSEKTDRQALRRGIRRFPYSTDIKVNPLTYAHVHREAVVPRDVAIKNEGLWNIPNYEFHNAGEVWALALWEVYAALLNHHGYSEGYDRMMQYIVAGLKVMPADLTFLEARDSILAVMKASDDEDVLLAWNAFSKRGMGPLSNQGYREDPTNGFISESFENGGHLKIENLTLEEGGTNCDNDSIVDSDENAFITFDIVNDGSQDLNVTEVMLSELEGSHFTWLEEKNFIIEHLKPLERKSFRIQVKLNNLMQKKSIQLMLKVKNLEAIGSTEVTMEQIVDVNYDEGVQSRIANNEGTKTQFITRIDGVNVRRGFHRIVNEDDSQYWYAQAYELSNSGVVHLTSPKIDVAEQNFSLRFKHRHDFNEGELYIRGAEESTHGYFDGGRIEVTLDDGMTWQDIQEYSDVEYDQVITTLEVSDWTGLEQKSPFAGQKAYTGTNPSFPEWDIELINFSKNLANKSVQFRFSMSFDSSNEGSTVEHFFTGRPGWLIDDIEVVGAENTPFYMNLDENFDCEDSEITDPSLDDNPVKDSGKQDDLREDENKSDADNSRVELSGSGGCFSLKHDLSLNLFSLMMLFFIRKKRK